MRDKVLNVFQKTTTLGLFGLTCVGAYITGDGVYRIVSHRMVHGYSTPVKKETEAVTDNSNK